MGNIISRIVVFFASRPLFFGIVFGAVILFLFIGLSRLKVNRDIYSIFPQKKEYKQLNDIVQENALNKQIFFSIDNIDTSINFDETLFYLENELSSSLKGMVKDIKIINSIDERELMLYYQKKSTLIFNDYDYLSLDSLLNEKGLDNKIKSTISLLKNNNGFYLKDVLTQDPLGLTFKHINLLKDAQNINQYNYRDGIMYSSDNKNIFFFGTIEVDTKDIKKLSDIDEKLKQFKQNFNLNKKINFDYFGTFQIAVDNSMQINKDTFLTSIISLVCILVLIIYFFKSFLAPFLFLFPALFGLLFGVGSAGFIHNEISAISLATVSVLLGIVLDYAFHFNTHYKHTKNVVDTVKEISLPMIVGSFTTIAALGALLFANSIILQNFGLLALFTLLGSIVYTLIIQPVLFLLFNFKINSKSQEDRVYLSNKWVFRIGILTMILLTVISLFNGIRLTFDSDLNNLSFHSDLLKQKEIKFTGINPNNQKKIFIISSDSNRQIALRKNNNLYDSLMRYKETFNIKDIISISPHLPDSQQVKIGLSRWVSFWESRKEVVKNKLQLECFKNGLDKNTFLPFITWVDNPNFNLSEHNSLFKSMSLDNFYFNKDQKHSYITTIVVEKTTLPIVKQYIYKFNSFYILDIAEITDSMIIEVQNDLNFLLLFSMLLVFISLLVLYGRIELALFSFTPMIMSWIWILGLSNFLDIKFNFVNIIITTFIFGLGDDFSIFTTNSLIQKYRNGISNLKAYQSAILISGTTTLFGLGSLFFAKHPAINSIATIGTIGIAIILFISIFIQPFIFNFFVFNRIKKKRSVVTFFTLIYSLLLFLYFFLGCIILNVFLLFFLMPFPTTKKNKQLILNYLISKLAKSTIYAGFHVKKTIEIDNVDFSKPKILIANHSSFLDILLMILLNPKIVIMVRSWVYNSPVFGLFIRYAGYPFSQDGAVNNLDHMKKLIADGYSIVIFPEGTRSPDGEIKRFHKGAFYIAQVLQLDIQPFVLIGPHNVNPKNDFLINSGHLIVKAIDPILYSPSSDYSKISKEVKLKMINEYKRWFKVYARNTYWKPFIIKNYIFKGPVLEWYVRIKWMLEKNNFDFYDDYIQNRKVIYDFGCGLGYLSYYLHYRDSDRLITGVDYDIDKIMVADNSNKLNPNLKFVCSDLIEYEFKPCDVIFLNDVLHYLSNEEQINILNKCVDFINQDGIIFLREGIVSNDSKFKITRLIENISTRIYRFNKTKNNLEFISLDFIKNFASSRNLDLEIISHSKVTTNALIILKNKNAR